ncbi:hypothetical protein LPH50_08305 [Xylella taiwanensis]|uniref:Uncharacterized protein n=1 Tax=Xylella taiwanensis TaxID=1444770 RepID=Z9JKX1_9GAMM|nr:hypothetical protein [Xylella taiwanensis]EWS78481.1 hypothetical protein AF72_05340 [Xylella taiwanensis]MCD8455947.1 hypothetical protein [Xylella taiwanensis]MCD8458350.1 hypothetical protein [Xylella taiwanensis]MCD8460489.1 hypothetical protein [Xylella taiwanensis]MCD8463453.1 hypothetical protein [Xylella taiwanensis]
MHTKHTHLLGERVVAGLEKLLQISKGWMASPVSRLQAEMAQSLCITS